MADSCLGFDNLKYLTVVLHVKETKSEWGIMMGTLDNNTPPGNVNDQQFEHGEASGVARTYLLDNGEFGVINVNDINEIVLDIRTYEVESNCLNEAQVENVIDTDVTQHEEQDEVDGDAFERFTISAINLDEFFAIMMEDNGYDASTSFS
ncbi:hypothetical protein GH714_014392 [Hevea brasiliensis]|uniref:Uncharacterized protein n=1 Tax=Hevea brasiliensis TaxID=3981 RepID=A0A6A6LP35_HEVBR|nr:hypothetical protein GH714_014392 [Hevea brasiliensis]